MRKYGRTFHLPISPGATSDDKIMSSLDGLMVEDLVAWTVGDEGQSWDLTQSLDLRRQEGFVERVADTFHEADMPRRVGKYVRQGHVQSETHWMKVELILNRLATA